ncbi:MAG TPA: hypothetical protein VNV82_13185 [Bryobacteraceae bacterium]|jgi:hypothetical protein|nr:hypothetical protein [Bryobacteraceae bacterium]
MEDEKLEELRRFRRSAKTLEQRKQIDELIELVLIVDDPATSIEQKADAYVKMAALMYEEPPAL